MAVDSSAFLAAVKAGDAKRVVEMLNEDLSLTAARGENGVSAVLLSRYYGHEEVERALLARYSDLDIFEASAVGDVTRATALLNAERGLPHDYSLDGFTALHLAAFFGHAGVVNLLLRSGADVNAPARNPMQVQPLHSALAKGGPGVVEALLQAGADVNARQAGGYTPIHEAAMNGATDVVAALIDRGANPNVKNDDGKRPIDLAREKGHELVAALLAERAAAS